MSLRTEWKFQLAGWLLFTGSAVFYTWGAVAAGDWVDIAASLLFLVACLVFLAPLWKRRPQSG